MVFKNMSLEQVTKGVNINKEDQEPQKLNRWKEKSEPAKVIEKQQSVRQEGNQESVCPTVLWKQSISKLKSVSQKCLF